MLIAVYSRRAYSLTVFETIIDVTGDNAGPIFPEKTRPMKEFDFTGVIEPVPDKGGAYIRVPVDIKREYGKGRLKVHAEFDGIPYDGSIVNMGVRNDDGSVCYIIGIRKDIREKIGKGPGDAVDVKIIPQ